MGYKEIKRFRDGSVMIEIDGVISIVDAEMNEQVKQRNWPAVVAVKLQKQFPHMKIKYVNEELPGISVTSARKHYVLSQIDYLYKQLELLK